MKVLIIDDDKDVQDLITDWMEEEGYIPPPDTADTAQEGAGKINDKLDVVIFDLNLPDAKGEDVLAIIQKIWKPDIPFRVVVLTAADDAYKRLIGLDIDAIVSKPIDFPSLRRAMEGEPACL